MRTSDFAAVVSLLNVCVIVLAMAGSVDAVEIAIVGAGFEEHGGVEGEFGSGHPHEASRISSLYGVQKWLNGNYNEAVFPKVWEADWDTRYQSIHWPDDQSGDPWDPAEGPDVAGFPPAANNPDGGAFEGDKTFRAMAYDGVENIHEFFGSYGIYQILDEPVKANHLYTLSVAVGTGAEYATGTVAPDHGLELAAGGMTVNP